MDVTVTEEEGPPLRRVTISWQGDGGAGVIAFATADAGAVERHVRELGEDAAVLVAGPDAKVLADEVRARFADDATR